MNYTMIKQLCKLINVKSIVTITLTTVFSALSLKGKITPESFLTIFTVVIGFYFGTQAKKEDNK